MIKKSMSDSKTPDWEAVRADYERTGLTLAQILDRHGITRSRFDYEWKRRDWPRRTTRNKPGRADLVTRLFRMLERQIAQLETEVADNKDKEVTILGNLTRNLEKLIELDQKQDRAGNPNEQRTDIDHLRLRLSRRIAQLKDK